MRTVDLITKKRDGGELTETEINNLIAGYTQGTIPDYQMSAMAMAIFFRGMTPAERADLTMAMVHSGEMIDLSPIAGIKVDKHSTGGVGDTTTLVLAPLVASIGVPVAKMSGRGLGHTGGTIDKLESIPGFHVEMDNKTFLELVNRNGLAVIGQSDNLTPADKKLYGLRDVTGTVNSIPLIASSIMSKKIASGADAIVLDVKTGDGAFMKELAESEELAACMVDIGNRVGRRTIAVLSDMSQPLGNAIGNALEVKEAIDTLRGVGPEDLTELCLTLGSHMAVLAGVAANKAEARKLLEQAISTGQALEKFKTFLSAQGGDASVVDEPERLPTAKHRFAVPAMEAGYVRTIAAEKMGIAAMLLGAGRATKESIIDLAVGIVLHKKIGDPVEVGESLATIHANGEAVDEVLASIYASISISTEPVAPPPLLVGEIL
jgi:pyrimidine-nucleoside phosphorylase